VPGSFVFVGESATVDIEGFVSPGEVSRLVVTHVDDCCLECALDTSEVFLNGRALVPPSPVSTAIYTAVELAWASKSNKTYQVQYAVSPVTNLWTDLGPAIQGSGTTNYFFDNTRERPAKVYRVLGLT